MKLPHNYCVRFVLFLASCAGISSAAVAAPQATSAAAAGLSGTWEIQAIGQDGTRVLIAHDGDEFTLYRVMNPEFEGEKYKLEHLYKGRVAGKKVSGSLYVRDDQKLPFENLRPFDGEVQGANLIVIDDLPMKILKSEKPVIPVDVAKKKKKKRGGPPTAVRVANTQGLS